MTRLENMEKYENALKELDDAIYDAALALTEYHGNCKITGYIGAEAYCRKEVLIETVESVKSYRKQLNKFIHTGECKYTEQTMNRFIANSTSEIIKDTEALRTTLVSVSMSVELNMNDTMSAVASMKTLLTKFASGASRILSLILEDEFEHTVLVKLFKSVAEKKFGTNFTWIEGQVCVMQDIMKDIENNGTEYSVEEIDTYVDHLAEVLPKLMNVSINR